MSVDQEVAALGVEPVGNGQGVGVELDDRVERWPVTIERLDS